MLQNRQGSSNGVQFLKIQISGQNRIAPKRAAAYNTAPGVNNHAITVASNLRAGMNAALCGGNYKKLIFNGTGPEQYIPMRFSRNVSKIRRHTN